MVSSRYLFSCDLAQKEKDRPKDLREKSEDQSISRFLPQMFLFILSLIVVKGAKQFE